MKTISLIIVMVLSAVTAFADPSPAEIQQAENTLSAAKNFLVCPATMPDGPAAEAPGKVVSYLQGDVIVQLGSSLSQKEAYLLYCAGGESGE